MGIMVRGATFERFPLFLFLSGSMFMFLQSWASASSSNLLVIPQEEETREEEEEQPESPNVDLLATLLSPASKRGVEDDECAGHREMLKDLYHIVEEEIVNFESCLASKE